MRHVSLQHLAVALLIAAVLGWGTASPARAGDPPPPSPRPEDRPPAPDAGPGARPALPLDARVRPAQDYPEIIGEAVGPQNHAHWPIRVQSLDRVHWTFDEGRHVGMALPLGSQRLAIQAGGGGIRRVDAATGKRTWYRPGETRFWNYSMCVAGPGQVTYGGNYDWVQAVGPDGKRLWRTDLQARWIHRPPALSPDGKTLYVAGDGVGLAALNAENGLVEWLRRDFGSPWNTYCFDDVGRLIATTRAGTSCFARGGKRLWSLEDSLAHLMVVGKVLLGARRDGLVAYDLQTRALLWHLPSPGTITGLALGDDGRIVGSSDDGRVLSLDQRGRLRWRRKISTHALFAPVTTQGGEVLVANAEGTLYLLGAGGRVLSSIETGGAPFRWRPSVGPDGRVYFGQAQRILCIGGEKRPVSEPVTATELTVVADDFVVDVWVNGEKLPLSAREMIGEHFGAMTERVLVDLEEGDWIVFNVVANRMRWNGASYFGVHATGPEGEMAFVSTTKGGWCVCDDPSRAKAFIASRDEGRETAALAPKNPWSSAPQIWRDVLGRDFPGTPIWGSTPLTWIKYVVGPPGGRAPLLRAFPPETGHESAQTAAAREGSSRRYWLAKLARLKTGMTPAQVHEALPPLTDTGSGVGLTGGGQVRLYQVSARWLVQLTFLHEGGLTDKRILIDLAGRPGTNRVLCLVTERGYYGGWKTLGEILVDENGAYAWTRYDFTNPAAPTSRTVAGRLDADLLGRLKATFQGPNREHQVWVDDSKIRHPDSVVRLRNQLYDSHRDGGV